MKNLTAISLLSLSLALAGCSKNQGNLGEDQLVTGSTTPAAASAPNPAAGSFVETKRLADQWQARPGDDKVGMAYAESLGKMGQESLQFDVLKSVSVAHPQDGPLQEKIGKILLNSGRAGEAATVLERATASGGGSWKTYSALGSAYDQMGRFELARSQYNKALAMQPGSLPVMNNLGMSFALQRKLPEAEKVLRQAQAQPDSATLPKIRQNLALVVGLQGRLEEAKQIASADLPPEQVETNMQFLKDMLAKPNTWAQLSNQN